MRVLIFDESVTILHLENTIFVFIHLKKNYFSHVSLVIRVWLQFVIFICVQFVYSL